jgi:hypothetical protein
MIWTYRILAGLALIGAGAVSGGILPVGLAAVFTALGGAAMLFHDKPGGPPAP